MFNQSQIQIEEQIQIKPDNLEKTELKLFDDSYYQNYRENNNYIEPDNLFNALINDLMLYLQEINFSSEIKVGYIFYSKMSLNSSKLNTIFNLLVQHKNPNIRIQSLWDVQSTFKGPMQTSNGIQIIDVDKIRVKIIVKPNDKDFTIKRLTEMNLNYMKKNTKKINDYLVKYNY